MARHHGVADGTGGHVDAIPSRAGRGRGYRPLCASAVHTISAWTTLCHLIPAPGTTRHGKSSPGHHSLGISIQAQPLPPSHGNLLQGLDNLEIRVCRASHDGSASAPAEPRPLSQSAHDDRRVDRYAPLQANTGAPTMHRNGCDRCVAPVLQGQDHSVNHAATATGYRARTSRLHSHDAM